MRWLDIHRPTLSRICGQMNFLRYSMVNITTGLPFLHVQGRFQILPADHLSTVLLESAFDAVCALSQITRKPTCEIFKYQFFFLKIESDYLRFEFYS